MSAPGLRWNWTKHYLDFGYPLSFNGHIFNTKEITKLIKKVRADNYIELEEKLQMFDYYPKEYMASFPMNVAMCINEVTSDKIPIEKFNNPGWRYDINSILIQPERKSCEFGMNLNIKEE